VIHIKVYSDWIEITKEEYLPNYTDKINYSADYSNGSINVKYFKRKYKIAFGKEWFDKNKERSVD